MTRGVWVLVSVGWLSGCTDRASEIATDAPALYFDMFAGADHDMTAFNEAWTAAREAPAVGVAYTFPLHSSGLPRGTTVRLYAGPYTGLHTGDDFVLDDEFQLTTSTIDDDGRAEFRRLLVSATSWSTGTDAIPAHLLCGETQLVARAFRDTSGQVRGSELLATAGFVAVTPPCP